MKFALAPLVAASFLGLCAAASAQQATRSLHVTGHLQGYSCMMLNLTNEQMMVFDNLPPIRDRPSPTAKQIGVASETVIVATPRRQEGNFIQVLHMNGQPGWLEADKVKPWRSANNPNAHCTPAMMSNGRPGFDYTRPAG